MPYLIDGNNVLGAFKKAGHELARGQLVKMLVHLAAKGEPVAVVFDGHRPPPALYRQMLDPAVEIEFSEKAPADDLIIERIAANTAPRRLIVVSTDRQIRQAAHRRRCRIVLSEEFVPLLIAACQAPADRPREAREKFRGLNQDETAEWLKEFHVDSDDD